MVTSTAVRDIAVGRGVGFTNSPPLSDRFHETFHADGRQWPAVVTGRSDLNPPMAWPTRAGGKSGPGKARLTHPKRRRWLGAAAALAAMALRSQAASTFGMISSFSRLRSSSVFETGTSANGGQMSSIVSPASFSRLRLSVTCAAVPTSRLLPFPSGV